MARRKTLTDEGVKALRPKSKRYAHPDPELPSHYIRVTPAGAKSFVVVVRDRDGRQRWETIGTWPVYPIDAARKRAVEILRAIREGKSTPESFEAVAATWRELHCVNNGLRSHRHLARLRNEWTGRDLKSIGRADVTKLLDKIELNLGQRQANRALVVFSAMANWYAARDDDTAHQSLRGCAAASPWSEIES